MQQLHDFELALQLTPLPMLLVSESGEILLVNDLFAHLFEYSNEDLIAENVEILVPALSRDAHPKMRDTYFTKPSKRNMGRGRELAGVTRTGMTIPLELALDIVKVNETPCALVVAVDIRLRKQQEQYMKLAMDAAASAMITVNTDGKLMFVNKAAQLLFGYKDDELLGLPLEVLVPDDIKPVHSQYREGFMKQSQTRGMASGLELFAKHQSGELIPVEIALTPVETSEGMLVCGTIIDLTERKRSEQAIRKKNAELATMNEDLQQFTYSVSHDLKTPMSTMVGIVNICLEDIENGDTDEVKDNLERILQIGKRNVERVEQVLAIAKVQQTKIQAVSIDLKTICDDIWLDLDGANCSSVELRLAFTHCEPVMQEPDTIKLILQNLVSNAIRYADDSKTKSHITIRSRTLHCGALEMSVKDNGLGIPELKQDTVFDMFSRIDERSDNGLGLALAKKQVDRLNGTIGFKSTFGEGTRFYFSLPTVS